MRLVHLMVYHTTHDLLVMAHHHSVLHLGQCITLSISNMLLRTRWIREYRHELWYVIRLNLGGQALTSSSPVPTHTALLHHITPHMLTLGLLLDHSICTVSLVNGCTALGTAKSIDLNTEPTLRARPCLLHISPILLRLELSQRDLRRSLKCLQGVEPIRST